MITVIIATYNSELHIRQSVDSIIEQSYQQFEIIVIDGSSSDDTVRILEEYGDRVSLFSEPDNGIYEAFNKGLKKAQGDYIMFLGSDDYLHSRTVFEELKEATTKNDLIIYSKAKIVNEAGEVLGSKGAAWKVAEKEFKVGRLRLFPHPTILHHKSLFESESFDESFKIAGDLDFLFRVIKNFNITPVFIDIYSVVIRIGGISSKANTQLLSINEAKCVLKKGSDLTFVVNLDFMYRKLKVLIKMALSYLR